jgi:hypothetical protein
VVKIGEIKIGALNEDLLASVTALATTIIVVAIDSN